MALEHDSESALAKAVRKAGSQSAFGRIVGKRQSVIHGWLRDERPLMAELVLMVEAATGVSRYELRPDIFQIEETRSPPSLGAGAPEESTVQSSSGVGPIESART